MEQEVDYCFWLNNLLPPHLNFFRSFDSELYLAVSVAEYSDFDIVIDDDGLVLTSGEYEHHASPVPFENHILPLNYCKTKIHDL